MVRDGDRGVFIWSSEGGGSSSNPNRNRTRLFLFAKSKYKTEEDDDEVVLTQRMQQIFTIVLRGVDSK